MAAQEGVPLVHDDQEGDAVHEAQEPQEKKAREPVRCVLPVVAHACRLRRPLALAVRTKELDKAMRVREERLIGPATSQHGLCGHDSRPPRDVGPCAVLVVRHGAPNTVTGQGFQSFNDNVDSPSFFSFVYPRGRALHGQSTTSARPFSGATASSRASWTRTPGAWPLRSGPAPFSDSRGPNYVPGVAYG